MQPQTQHIEFQGWQRLVGRCATEATRPAFPSTVVSGQATFEWLADQRFLIQLCHYDHPEIPDAIAVIDGSRRCTSCTRRLSCRGAATPTPAQWPGEREVAEPAILTA